MTPTRTGVHTEAFREQRGLFLTTGLAAATAAAAAGDFKQVTTLAERFTAGVLRLRYSVVGDALAAWLDWWQIGELLARRPQAAFDVASRRTRFGAHQC